MRSIIIAVLTLLLAPSASAVNEKWYLYGNQNKPVTGIKVGEWVSSTPDSETDDTEILSIGCENFELLEARTL